MNPQIRKFLSYLPAAVVVFCALGIAGNGLHLGAVACQSYWVTSKLRSPEQPPKPGPPATGLPATGLPGAKNAVPGPTPGSPPQMGKGDPPAQPPTPGGAPLPGGKRGQMPQPGGNPGQPGGGLGPYQEIVTKGLFSKQQPSPPPVCTGIIGGEALINNTMVKVGGQIGEWKLVEIGVDKVVVEKAGNRMDLKIFPDLQQNPSAFPPLPRRAREALPRRRQRRAAHRFPAANVDRGPNPEESLGNREKDWDLTRRSSQKVFSPNNSPRRLLSAPASSEAKRSSTTRW